jgi:F420-dependent methylenetetrahydromethanopterin dehydrogenase
MPYDPRPSAKSCGIGAALLIVALMLVPTFSLADALKCKIEGYNEDIFITTSPDTNQDDGQYARIGISRGIGNRAIVVADRMGAVAFVELNTDGTPIGLITVQKDMRVINSRQSIDPNGMVSAPSQRTGVCTRSPS